MPTPLEFMERVLPWPGPNGSGWGNLHWSLTKPGHDGKPRKHWRGAPYKTAQELIERAQKLTMAPADVCEDIFFCTSLQSTTETVTYGDRTFVVASRHKETACSIKALFLDIDVKDPPKGYATKEEAWDALQKFLVSANLPQPSAVVWSGGGMHVYWFSDVPLTVAQWAPFAEGLKAEAMRLGLRADYGVTTDPARILRVPGTYNNKIPGRPRAVKIAALGQDYSFATDLAHLAAIGAPYVTAAVTKAAPFDLSAFQGYNLAAVNPALAAALAPLTDKLSDGIDRHSDLPLDPTEVIKGCPHFRDALIHNGAGHGQGLWMLTVLASTWFENGYECAKTFSKGYAGYDQTEGELKAMWERKLDDRKSGIGWPSCKSFENEGCKHCATCVFKPQGKSPLNLASRVKPDEPDPIQQIVTNPITQVVLTVDDLKLPDNYVLWNGRIARKVNLEEDPKAPPQYDYIPVFDGEIICKPRTSNTRPPNLYFKYKHGDNYSDVNLPYVAMANDQALSTAFLDAGISVNPDADKFVRRFMRSWVSKIDAATRRMTTAPLGWVYENGQRMGFAYGGTLFHSDGTEEDSAYAETKFIKDLTPTGSVEPVMKAIEALCADKHAALEILALQSWASPLLEVTGHKSTSVMYGYSDSGARKSSALKTGMALWCAPDAVREKGGVTETALENKMNLLRNLPAVLDELYDTDQIDKVAPLFNRLHEGGQGSRANNKGGLRDRASWQLILTCGSNKSIYEYFDKKNVETDARALRMFQLFVERRDTNRNKTEMEVLLGSLEHNFGHLGLRYAKYLAMNVDKLSQWYEKLAQKVDQELAPPGEPGTPAQERFWKVSVVLTLMSAEIANQIMDKQLFHYDEIKQCLYATYRQNRAWVKERVNTIASTKDNTTEVWGKVMASWIINQLVTDTMHRGGKGRSMEAAVQIWQQPPKDRGCPVYIHWLQNPPMVRIAHTALRELLLSMNEGSMTLDRLEKMYAGKRERMTFLAGIPIQEAKSRITVWEIPITDGHPLYDAWAAKMPVPPANSTSEAMAAQDDALAKGAAQAAKDAATVAAAGAQ